MIWNVNPYYTNRRDFEMVNLERTMRPVIERAANGFRVILLTGQRQAGKSTMLQDMAKGTKRKYVSLDDMNKGIGKTAKESRDWRGALFEAGKDTALARSRFDPGLGNLN
jgi:predicted AAA+ superfamily ATPase